MATRHGFSRSVMMFSMATKRMDRAMMGSMICDGGRMKPYMASPNVMECATVKAVACHSTGFRRGSKM